MSNIATIGLKAFQINQVTYRVDSGMPFIVRVAEGLGRVDMTPGAKLLLKTRWIYVEGEGVLGVFNRNGELAFTRRGDLRINAEGILQNGSGFTVADDAGGEIQFDPGLIHRISTEGVICVGPEEEIAEEVEVGRLL